MKKSKKLLSILLTAVIAFSAIMVMPAAGAATAAEFSVSGLTETGESSLVYAGGKYIVANKKGIFVKKSVTASPKKITTKSARGRIVSDGKIIYFLVQSGEKSGNYKYTVYSVKTNGKSLKKIRSAKGCAELLACYNGKLYFNDTAGKYTLNKTRIVGLNLKSKKAANITKSKKANVAMYYKSKIYFCYRADTDMDTQKTAVYSVNLRNNKVSKVLSKAAIELQEENTGAPVLGSYKLDKQNFSYKNMYVYTINSKHKVTKSHSFPNNMLPQYVNGKYAIAMDMATFSTYKITLKSGAKKKLTGNYQMFMDVTSGVKSSNSVYGITISSMFGGAGDDDLDTMVVKKLVGNRFVSCKVGGKTNFTGDNWWIAGNYIIVDNNSKINTYKLATA